MAEFLIRQWQLCVLSVRLDVSSRQPVVRASLVDMSDESPHRLWEQAFSPEDFGIPRRGTPDRLVLPDDLLAAVSRILVEELPQETALWLRLVPPYGYLGAAPWEERLVPAMGRPVLRVPDRLPVATDFGEVWTAVVAVNADPTSDWAAPYLHSFLDTLRERVHGELSVHVFADADTTHRLLELRGPEAAAHADLSSPTTDVAAGSWWHLHDPDRSRRRATPTPWSEWIRGGLAGCAVRSFHVVTEATFDADQPMLLVAPDPDAPTTEPNLVPDDDVLRLADSIGAATLSFGSPPGNPSDLATRMLADGVGRVRPGPTLYSCLDEDPAGWALAGAHAYLADPHGDQPLPWHSSLFLYVQPEHVRRSLMRGWPEGPAPGSGAAGELLPSMPVPPTPAGRTTRAGSARAPFGPSAPGWYAATQRYLDHQWSSVAKSAPAGSAKARHDLRDAYDEGAAEALLDLQDVIDTYGGQWGPP